MPTSQRKSAICYPKPTKTVIPENYCYIEGCIFNSLYKCNICDNHVCINHKFGDLNQDFIVCRNCNVNPEYRDIICTNNKYYYNKNKRNKYIQKFINCISFEWLHNKVHPS
jgi:hypothetical protein